MNSSRAALVFDDTRSAAFSRQNPKTVVRQTRQYLLILKSGLMICMFDAAYTYIYETVKDARRCVNTYPGN
jgi:hypothetical protein